MNTNRKQAKIIGQLTRQKNAFEAREKSPAEINYGRVMQKSVKILMEFTKSATFDQLLHVESAFQKNDLTIYARLPATIKDTQEGINDFLDAQAVYQQLLTDPAAYQAHRYREKERTGPDKKIPLDAMRRALRGQAARVENYRRNVMGNPGEQAFLAARVSLIRHAEKLYDAIQRDRLLPPE